MKHGRLPEAGMVALAIIMVATGCGDDGTGPQNRAPVITGLTVDPDSLVPRTSCSITCSAVDPDGDVLDYWWSSYTGIISGTGPQITWIAPLTLGTHSVLVTVSDGKGGSAADTARIVVVSDSLETSPEPETR